MATVEFNGKTFEVDEDGFLLDYNSYSDEWVDYVKSQEGIEEMTEEHWKLVKVLQDYYEKTVLLLWFGFFPNSPNSSSNTFTSCFLPAPEKVPVKWPVFPSLLDVCKPQIQFDLN